MLPQELTQESLVIVLAMSLTWLDRGKLLIEESRPNEAKITNRELSFTINTACSSSVYAFHQAINALHQRDCEAAVVGGTNLILTVDQHMNTAKLGVLSPTSTCHTFDASADG